MGDKINEIRRRISRLRADMLSLQQDIRCLVNHGLGCTEPSARLMTMQVEMVDLILRRSAAGSLEVCPATAERSRPNDRLERQRGAGRDLGAKAQQTPGKDPRRAVTGPMNHEKSPVKAGLSRFRCEPRR
jgi:hypothetical protein